MESLLARIRRHEGLRLEIYTDTTGNATIGYGHKIIGDEAQEYANGISPDEAENLLGDDVMAARDELAKQMPWTTDLPSVRWGILVEMVFQMGINGLFGFKNFLYCARCGDFEGAAAEMRDSEWYKQTPARAEELAALWLNGTNSQSVP